MMIQFFGGEGRCYKSVNYLIGEDREKGISIYAEVEIPEDISDDYDLTIDYGYLTMKKAIIQCLPAEVMEQIEWFYDNDKYLPEDASADCDVFVDCDFPSQEEIKEKARKLYMAIMDDKICWDLDAIYELCDLAGLSDEFDAMVMNGDDDFGDLIDKAAGIIGIEI